MSRAQFGKYGVSCPNCLEHDFEYGVVILNNGEKFKAVGNCSTCDFVPEPIYWDAETGIDAAQTGWNLVNEAYKIWGPS